MSDSWTHVWNGDQDDFGQNAEYAYESHISLIKSVDTPFGEVQIAKIDSALEPGWRRMRLEEGKQVKEQLNKLMGSWSIVAFQTGKLDGTGYGNNFHETCGSECGEMFILRAGAP